QYANTISHLPYTYISACLLYIAPSPPEIYTLSLHDALPISEQVDIALQLAAVLTGQHAARGNPGLVEVERIRSDRREQQVVEPRSEEHTSELQSRVDLVCRLLLEKKNQKARNSVEAQDDHRT